jgi:hypothetical protein
MINYEPITMLERYGPNINIITKTWRNNGANVESPHQIQIQKAIPTNTKYDPIKQKEFFKGVV